MYASSAPPTRISPARSPQAVFADLYYRLNVIELRVPPLRERREDIGLLADVMLRRLAQECGEATARLHPDATAKLENYRFPGNVRELENMLERAYTLCEGDEIKAGDLRLADSPGLPENGEASLAQIDSTEDHTRRSSAS